MGGWIVSVWRGHTEDGTGLGHGGWPHAGTHCPLQAALRRQPSQLLSLKPRCQVGPPACLCALRQNPGPKEVAPKQSCLGPHQLPEFVCGSN